MNTQERTVIIILLFLLFSSLYYFFFHTSNLVVNNLVINYGRTFVKEESPDLLNKSYTLRYNDSNYLVVTPFLKSLKDMNERDVVSINIDLARSFLQFEEDPKYGFYTEKNIKIDGAINRKDSFGSFLVDGKIMNYCYWYFDSNSPILKEYFPELKNKKYYIISYSIVLNEIGDKGSGVLISGVYELENKKMFDKVIQGLKIKK